MLLLERVRLLLSRANYAPSGIPWTFGAERGYTDDAVHVTVQAVNHPDTYDLTRTVNPSMMFVLPAQAIGWPDAELLRFVFVCIMQLWEHETAEFFTFADDRVFDPHRTPHVYHPNAAWRRMAEYAHVEWHPMIGA